VTDGGGVEVTAAAATPPKPQRTVAATAVPIICRKGTREGCQDPLKGLLSAGGFAGRLVLLLRRRGRMGLSKLTRGLESR